ncbi:hypothetical protein ACIQNG_21635 [Streptomyces sp. NPDC091377]|uniref:hypothetical protein n=1 Tax=Streptomyces sp. NPDC091377 TaxID=3365995 RepID=UPI00382B3C78
MRSATSGSGRPVRFRTAYATIARPSGCDGVQLARNQRFTLHELTDQGRARVTRVTARDGPVTLTGEKGRPYVLVPVGGKAPHRDVRYGESSGLTDPGFRADAGPDGTASACPVRVERASVRGIGCRSC